MKEWTSSLNLPDVDAPASQTRVKPEQVTLTSIRLIWAVTAEVKDAATCRKLTRAKIEKTSAGLAAIQVGKEMIFEDFISVIPRFEWIAENRKDEEALVETQTDIECRLTYILRLRPMSRR